MALFLQWDIFYIMIFYDTNTHTINVVRKWLNQTNNIINVHCNKNEKIKKILHSHPVGGDMH